MGGMTRQTISRAMYFNRCHRPLRLFMATQTVLRSKRVILCRRSYVRALSEGVTTQAVSHDAASILFLSLGTRVLKLRFLFVAAGATLRSHLPHFSLRKVVTGRARNFFLQHVNPVPQYIAGLLPLFGDVDPFTPFLRRHFVGRTAGEEKSEDPDDQLKDRAKQ